MQQNPNIYFENRRLIQEIKILNKELEELKFKHEAISSSQENYLFPMDWGLTARESQLLYALYQKEFLSENAFMEEFYYSKNNIVDKKIFSVYICKLRSKIKRHCLPVKIITNWNIGYTFTPESKRFLSQFIIEKPSYEDMRDSFERQPWHSYDEYRYMFHEQAISKLQILTKTTEITNERYAIAYARLRGFIRDQSGTLLGPLDK